MWEIRNYHNQIHWTKKETAEPNTEWNVNVRRISFGLLVLFSFLSLFVCVSLSSFEFTVSVLDVVHFIQFECRMWMRMWIVLWNRNVNPVSKSKRGVDWRMSDIGCWMWEDINERPYVFRFCATKNLNSKKPRKKEKSACFLLEWNCCWCWGR